MIRYFFWAVLTVAVVFFVSQTIALAFTANGKKVVAEGDPITLFKTFTGARTVTETEKARWTFGNRSTLLQVGEAGGMPLWAGAPWPVTGNALTATRLQTARTINGVSFDGSANITVADATKEPIIAAGTTAQYRRGDKTWQALNPPAVGLGNVTNDQQVKLSQLTGLTTGILKNTAGVLSTAGSADFPTLNQSTTGNAATATKLQTARTINGVSFDGSANITVADATKEPIIAAGTTAQYRRGDKTWQTLNSAAVGLGNVTNDQQVKLSQLTGLTTGILKNTAGALSTAGAVDFPTLNQSTTGNAATATKLQTARTINGVSFDGSANITVADPTKIPLSDENVIFLNPSEGGTVIYSLPTYAGVSPTVRYNIKNIGQGGAIVNTVDGKTIDGLSTMELLPGDRCKLAKDGTNWQSI